MSAVKKPILLDETGKEIVAHMRAQNALLSAIARESIGAFTSWKDIQAIVKQGIAPEIFHIGDQFIVPWKDVEADRSFDVPLDIVHFGNVELKSGEVVPAMFLQWHYAMPFGVQFDAPENEIANGTKYSTGYSYYHLVDGKYNLLTPGVDYNIGDTIPSSADTGVSVDKYYRSAIKDPSGSICKNGYNRWSHSAIRQFLNSKAGKDAWWVAQHLGDMKPEQLTSKAGFMTGFEEDFLSCLNPIKVTTALNTVTDSDIGTTEDTYDTFFLPSLEQMYVIPEVAGVEGNYFEYWKHATGATKPNKTGVPNTWYESRDPVYIIYGIDAKTSPRSVRLRSAKSSTSYNTWSTDEDGYITTNYAYRARYCTPVCAVC